MSGRSYPAPSDMDGEFVPDSELLRDPPVLAGGRIGPSLATFDAPALEFDTSTPAEIRDRHRPPTAWEVDDDQMESLVDFTRSRKDIMEQMEDDPAWRYLNLLAGYMGVDMSRLSQPVARRTFRDEESRQFQWALADERALERPGLGAPLIGGGPSPFVTGVGGLPPPPPPLEGPPQAPPVPIGTRLRENERLRIANAAEWAWRPEVLGVIGLPPTVFTHTVKAFRELRTRVPHFRDVPDFHAFVQTKHLTLCDAFAELAFQLMTLSKQKSAATAYLDKADARVKREVQRIAGQIAKDWEWSERDGDFVERGAHWGHHRQSYDPDRNRFLMVG